MTSTKTTGRSAARSRIRRSGSRRTQRFYDETGWTRDGGKLVDLEMFGNKEDGPIRIELHQAFQQRIHDAVARAGTDVDLLECGCGGSPEISLLDLCATYTGVDFSDTGLRQASRKLDQHDVPYRLHKADACHLPFDDHRFDAVYSARMIFHIPDPEAQAAAIAEMVRVTRPGGTIVIITANPFPLLFPGRLMRRVVALTPLVGDLANRIRPTPPLPYQPMSLRWFRRRIGDSGSVEMISNGLPSTAFNQQVSEYNVIGSRLWRLVRWMELTHPKRAVPLGNYTQISITKT